MSSRTLKILELVSNKEVNSFEPVQENYPKINLEDVPIIFEDKLSVPCGISCSKNDIFDQRELKNCNQYAEYSNHKQLKISETVSTGIEISASLDLPVSTEAEVPSTSGLSSSCYSKRNIDQSSDSESCSSSNSLYVPEQAEEESSDSSASERSQNINLPEVNFEQPEYGNMKEGRKRKKIADQTQWKKNRNEKLRERGKQYLGYSRSRDGRVKQDSLRPERKMGEACNSPFCRKSSKRECQAFSEEKRKEVFEQFWFSLSWDQKKIFVCTHVSRVDTQKKTATQNEVSRREGSLKYSLSNGQIKVPVCRNFFLSTLGLRPFTVQSWVKQSINGMKEEKRQQNEKRKDRNYRVKKFREHHAFLINFLKELPKQPSHYVRKDTNKLFLEEHFTSMKQLYDKYLEICQKDDMTPLGRYVFEKTFKEQNLSLFSPKKDRCDICIQYEHGNVSVDQWKRHIDKKEKVREEKENDVKDAKEKKCILLTMDLQAVKVAPYLNATSIYFKTKLSCHNFTIYNVENHKVSCYWFTENDTNLNASTFVSCLLDYITKNCLPLNIPIIIYSDGCTFQNRNVVMANALLNFSIIHNLTILQKYLEKGHTQMEVDSVHSCIERKLKNRKIYLPSDYLKATEEARKNPEPYKPIKLEYDFFKDFANVENFRYTSIRPGKKSLDPTVTDIVAIKYSDGIIQIKLDFSKEWEPLPLRKKSIDPILLYPQAHASQLPLKKKKWLHLQALKSVIPKDSGFYYDSLPYQNDN